jgi:uncharacterized protein (TIGR04255 family)
MPKVSGVQPAPPLVEVVCGVQFAPVEGFSSVHFGEFWQELGPEYVRTEDKAPLAEHSDAPLVESTTEVLSMPPLRRVFYVARDENFIYQLQPTRFLSNWRRHRAEDSYPKFEAAYDRFCRGWQLFQSFATARSLGSIAPDYYELTYINHIPEGDKPFPIGIEDYLPLFSWTTAMSNARVSPPRSAVFSLVFPLKDIKGNLHITAKHGLRQADKRNILVLELTARGPADQESASMDTWFTMAHRNAVYGFKDLTSPAAQTAWGWPE